MYECIINTVVKSPAYASTHTYMHWHKQGLNICTGKGDFSTKNKYSMCCLSKIAVGHKPTTTGGATFNSIIIPNICQTYQ